MKSPDMAPRRGMQGISMIEILVTIVVIAVGLLGMAVLQMSSMNGQLEAYQRAQALFLMEDMANRIRVNSVAARGGAYGDATGFGQQDVEDCTTKATQAERDLCEWNVALMGASATLDGNNVGTVVGANACIENVAGSPDGETIIRLTVAWQGMAPTISPVSNCGRGTFGADDRYRRVATVDTVLADLTL